ncbi:MAG: hypothetical protein OXR62_11525 [Ahrensia sp.]|nr:hypothetical protein [Ahrensia sp.]
MIDFLPDNLPHIFGDRHGHLTDTPENRQLLLNLVNNAQSYLGEDKFGQSCYAATEQDGSQLWAVVFDGTIRNGGRNEAPWSFTATEGFQRPHRRLGD